MYKKRQMFHYSFSGICKDFNTRCPQWKEYCTTSMYVKSKCLKTCKHCDGVVTTPKTATTTTTKRPKTTKRPTTKTTTTTKKPTTTKAPKTTKRPVISGGKYLSNINIKYTSCKRSIARRVRVSLTPETVVTMHVFISK